MRDRDICIPVPTYRSVNKCVHYIIPRSCYLAEQLNKARRPKIFVRKHALVRRKSGGACKCDTRNNIIDSDIEQRVDTGEVLLK